MLTKQRFLTGLLVLVCGCGGTDTSTQNGGSLGGNQSVGSSGTGGQASSGGAANATGGTKNGEPATGGNQTGGGKSATGGSSAAATGGSSPAATTKSSATGSLPATGGRPATGGNAAGGAGTVTPSGTGGASTVVAQTGGRASSGGAANTGTAASGGSAAAGGTAATGGAASTGGGSSCPFPTSFKWKDNGGPLAQPKSGWVALKDFTNVVYNGQHLIYMTTHDTTTNWGSAIMSFTDWSGAATATQTSMNTGTVAPTLFYFSPKSTWILAYQWCNAGKFCYGTSKDPTSQSSWTMNQALLSENVTGGGGTGPIDQTVICDSTKCYLFYADDNGHIYRGSMPIGSFPGKFSGTTRILTDTKNNLFEAVQVYAVKGTGKYLMIVEAMGGGGRFFRAYSADSLDGEFKAMAGAATEAQPFAGKSNVTFTGKAWTSDISHGDMVRENPDETQTIDPCHMQLLYQGRDPSSNVDYGLLPYKPGLLTKVD